MTELWRATFNQVADRMSGQPETLVKQALYEVLRDDAVDFTSSDLFLTNAAKLISTGYPYRL